MAIKFGKLVGGWRVVEKYKLLLSSFRRSRLHYCTLASCVVPPLTRARNDAFSGKGLDALLGRPPWKPLALLGKDGAC